MKTAITETPIWIVKDSEVKWEIAYEIHSIQLPHALAILENIKSDELFEDVEVDCQGYMERVSHIVLKAERYWLDLAIASDQFERRIDDIIEDYMKANGGYAAIRA